MATRETSPVVLRDIVLVSATPLLLAGIGLVHPHSLTAATAEQWAGLHIWLLPVFPLLTLGLVVPLWGRPGRDVAGVATVVAWVAAFGYAAYYTGLDAVAGIAAGTVRHHAGAQPASGVGDLFRRGDALGEAGVYALAVAVLATAVALFPRHGARVMPGTVVLLAACWFFTDGHIFWPEGVFAMLGFALGFALLAAMAPRSRPHSS
ncbi:hypothetical protein ACIHCQ_40490 [Streptomyces sp. NPDC052236]|uniref:hypothetical protein n=1 Tax=Streptomyces sp. NPDC052236 TaxID=3365686 RepID=UPI0037D0F958